MYVLGFEKLEKGGSKNLALARLFRQGFPVPLGCVLTIDAYYKYKEYGSPAELPAEIFSSLKSAYEELSVGEDMSSVDPKVLDFIKAARGQAFVAARGEGKALLNVRGMPQLQKAIKELWDHPCEILIQRMIDAEVTGTITERQGRLMIESWFGLSPLPENIPDRYIGEGGKIRVTLGEKQWRTVRDSLTGETMKDKVPSYLSRSQTLTADTLAHVIDLYRRIGQQNSVMTFAIERQKPSIIELSLPAVVPAQ